MARVRNWRWHPMDGNARIPESIGTIGQYNDPFRSRAPLADKRIDTGRVIRDNHGRQDRLQSVQTLAADRCLPAAFENNHLV